MTLNVASLNAWGLRDPSKCACLLGELSNLCVNVAAVQGLTSLAQRTVRCWRTTLWSFRHSVATVALGISLLVGRSFNDIVTLVFASDGGRLVVANVADKHFEFWVVAVYAPNSIGERRSFFRRFGLFLDDPNG